MTGDVNGPSSSVDNDVVLFDGTTGKLIKDSGKKLALSGLSDCVIDYPNGNMCLGPSDGAAITAGQYNVALGIDCLWQLTTGISNVALGTAALTGVVDGSHNIGIGSSAVQSVSSGSSNIGIGDNASTALSTGGQNIVLGTGAGGTLVSGSTNILIGYQVDVPTASTSNYLNIGGAITGPLSGPALVNGFTATTQSSGDSSTKIATTAYVDTTVSAITAGLDSRPSCRVATTAALTATYSNGSSGVGATLTNSGTKSAISIDGVSLSANDRVLVKNQATAAQNGIYTVTTVGSGSVNWVLTRATDFNTATGTGVVEGAFTVIEEGTSNYGTFWIETGAGPFTIGTTAITFTQLQVTNVTDAGILFSDITTNNASTSKHGFLKKLDNTATHYMDGTGNWSTPAATAHPTYQYLTSGSSATYTTPANCTAIHVEMVGGGGGGGAANNNAAGAGGDTIFNSVHAAGGSGGVAGNSGPPVRGGSGGSGGTGSATLRISGGDGSSNVDGTTVAGGNGGTSYFGGAGRGGVSSETGHAGATHSGSGGGGAGGAGGSAGSGGGAGEYVIVDISSPASTYTYTVGAAGSAGSAGGFAGGAGGSGFIRVTEYY